MPRAISGKNVMPRSASTISTSVSRLLAAKTPDEELIEETFLSALSRFPTAVEKKQMLAVLADATAKEQQLIARIEQVFQETLSRPPTPAEQANLQGATIGVEKRQAVEDLFWSILSSKEFLFHR